MSADILVHWPMWASLLAVVAAIILYMMDRWSMEVVSVGIITGLLILFTIPGAVGADGDPITPGELFSGFANPALITIMALLVVGQGLFQTGALEGPTKALVRSYDRRPRITLLMAFAAVFVTSAFTNNTPVVIMFLPIMSAMAARMGASTSRLMIPLSFVSILAGMTTLIGTSTNLLAADAYKRIEGVDLGFFAQTEMGLILAGVGLIYILIAAPILLPSRAGFAETFAISSKQFVAQFEVTPGHFLDGKTSVAGMFPELKDMTVRMIQRGEKAILPPYDEVSLKPGDLVIVAATRQALTDLLAGKPDMLEDIWQNEVSDSDNPDSQLGLVEAVIAPGSRMAGRTVEMLGFRRLTNAVTLGIQRRSRMIRTKLGEIRLEAGDTLLLCGPVAAFRNLRTNRDIILLEWSQTEFPTTTKAQLARLVTIAMVGVAALNLVSITIASVVAATAMIVLQCLNSRQASRALDLRIYLVIAAALAMGTSLELTGAADLIAHLVVALTSPYGTLAVASAIFLAVAILTNILSNAATAVLFAPIALSAADQLGAEPLPFLLAVIYAANCAFATPIAYQTNMLVMAPGHYKFGDFVRFGGPLVILIWATFTVVAPWRLAL
ncbi:SLC13 family permease [Hyphomonas sp. FCG-A18]|uniref:SLC13 family permease n=1 Tax=Hyphomonas sp. FCG-A18 TaxID=3080019 RepID=UPI002B2DF81B|nr:SLC13 family permease [Hyphomonas sp. FCG-A18]